MTSITCDAIANEGIIKIPDRYIAQLEPNVRVVLFPAKTKESRKSVKIPFYGFDTIGYRFDREEANER